PILKIAQLAKVHGIFYHVDCVQSFCKLDVTHYAQHADAISVSAHKVGGPKGCGAVYFNPFVRVMPIFPGVTHERGLRGGTLDTPALVAFGVAVEQFTYDVDKQWQLREKLVHMLPEEAFQVIEGQSVDQLPNIVGICKTGMEGQLVMLKLNEQNFHISTGSACDINSASGTKAILAMGKTITEARQFFRISFGANTKMDEVELCGEALREI
ncbi:MAG: aminotransferase class V-fold PLP-dependent enzyme, partial [Solibacillus sp.]